MSGGAKHKCPVKDCPKDGLPQHILMCVRHWRLVPHDLQREVYRKWNNGLGYGSQDHLRACGAAIAAVEKKLGLTTP